jgi:hypothetical protein
MRCKKALQIIVSDTPRQVSYIYFQFISPAPKSSVRLRFSASANGARGLMTANTMSVGFLVFEDIADELARDKARERIGNCVPTLRLYTATRLKALTKF